MVFWLVDNHLVSFYNMAFATINYQCTAKIGLWCSPLAASTSFPDLRWARSTSSTRRPAKGSSSSTLEANTRSPSPTWVVFNTEIELLGRKSKLLISWYLASSFLWMRRKHYIFKLAWSWMVSWLVTSTSPIVLRLIISSMFQAETLLLLSALYVTNPLPLLKARGYPMIGQM